MTVQVLEIGINELIPDPAQPRRSFIAEEINRLAASIAARGVLLPLRVQFDAERRCHRIIAGECRWRAARQAGLATVPCLPVEGELSEADILADQITENHLRHDLRPLELARAMAKLKAVKRCTSQDLADELGLSGASITRATSLLKLPEDVQQLVDDGRLAESVAYILSRFEDENDVRETANTIVRCRMNRDQAIELCKQKGEAKNGKPKTRPRRDRLSFKLEGVSFSFSAGKGLSVDSLLKAVEAIRSQLTLARDGGKDMAAVAKSLRAS